MNTPVPTAAGRAAGGSFAERLLRFLTARWWVSFVIVWGLFVGLPWLAPVFMRLGWEGGARAVYAFYSLQCHQLPERSYFLFGPKIMVGLDEIQAAWQNTSDPMILRQFIGNEAMGWKVGWSDRMVSMYTSIFVAGLLYPLFRKRLLPLPIWLFVLLVLPMAIDGTSHFVSDALATGIGQGFRDSNAWLAAATGEALPPGFYAGDALGSFNWLMRLVTGLLFGVAAVWLAFPYIDQTSREAVRELEVAAHFQVHAGRTGP